MTDTFFALFWCLSVNISLSFYYSIILKGSMAFFSSKHCTLPTTLEMSEINNQLLHFPTYYMWSNVLKMSCGKNFLEEHAFRLLKIGLCSAQQLFFPAYVHLQSLTLRPWFIPPTEDTQLSLKLKMTSAQVVTSLSLTIISSDGKHFYWMIKFWFHFFN